MRHTHIAAIFLVSSIVVLSSSIFLLTRTTLAVNQQDATVLELNQLIQEKKSKVTSLRQQIEAYQKKIKARQSEKVSLENELSIIEDHVSQKTLDIQALEDEIDQLQLEIQQADIQIEQSEAEISLQKMRLAEMVRRLYDNSERDYVELLLSNENFSDFFDHVRHLEEAQTDIAQSLARIKLLREQLEVQRASLHNNQLRQEDIKSNILKEKGVLEEHKAKKEQLILQTVLSTKKLQELIQQARRDQSQIATDIDQIEKEVRQKLKLNSKGTFQLAWPVDPSRGISALFHDPGYPFRYVYEHPAVDIRAYQGTYVRAAEDGYIGRAKNGGAKGYSYVMILHDRGISTVYGHLSRILVPEETYVQKGDVIGLSGGTPGTVGAGPFTTGPHLHFEVRVNGIPNDPLHYLP
ncbi:peptidoglycan DD-metalloendopeptidase family protein [Candidatus Uhrbacteria bacterium]|nr:peptidoglycan DD-metalloendopeptidase family protein [Candidatus Uhrbacteria bacterium]